MTVLPSPDPTSSATSPVIGRPTGQVQGTEPSTPTASSAHDMFIAIGILSVFVYVMVLVAGMSKNAGRFVVVLFVALIIIQGLGHVEPFAAFTLRHPLSPARSPAK